MDHRSVGLIYEAWDLTSNPVRIGWPAYFRAQAVEANYPSDTLNFWTVAH